MPHHPEQQSGEGGAARRSGSRRLIAGLRVGPQDAALLAVVRPFFPDITSEGELAYRLWHRGLEVTLGELAGLGATLPLGMSEELLASLVAQRLLLCLPLLRRTGTLGLLGIEPVPPLGVPAARQTTLGSSSKEAAIDAGASDAIVGLGGSDFL